MNNAPFLSGKGGDPKRIVTEALMKGALDAEAPQHFADLRPSAMDHDRIDPDVFHQDNVLRKTLLQLIGHHGMATVFDYHGALIKATYVRQCLNQNPCLLHLIPLFSDRTPH